MRVAVSKTTEDPRVEVHRKCLEDHADRIDYLIAIVKALALAAGFEFKFVPDGKTVPGSGTYTAVKIKRKQASIGLWPESSLADLLAPPEKKKNATKRRHKS